MDLKSKDYLHQTPTLEIPINHLNIKEGPSGHSLVQQSINQWSANELSAQRYAPNTDFVQITTAMENGTQLFEFTNDIHNDRVLEHLNAFETGYFKTYKFEMEWSIEVQSHIQHQGMLLLVNSPVHPRLNGKFFDHIMPVPNGVGNTMAMVRSPHIFIPLNGNCDTIKFKMPWISNYNSFPTDLSIYKNIDPFYNGKAALYLWQKLEVGPGVDVLPQIRITRKMQFLEHSAYQPISLK